MYGNFSSHYLILTCTVNAISLSLCLQRDPALEFSAFPLPPEKCSPRQAADVAELQNILAQAAAAAALRQSSSASRLPALRSKPSVRAMMLPSAAASAELFRYLFVYSNIQLDHCMMAACF
jgi:hypothetical protein